MSDPSFIHLNCHSEYSLVDGMLRIPTWLDEVRAQGMPAVALTDKNNLFAALKFYQAAVARGLKPLIGADLDIVDEKGALSSTILLCQNEIGYQHLTQLVSSAYTQEHAAGPAVALSNLRAKASGLIVILPMWTSDVALALLARDTERASRCLQRWQKDFADCCYFEVQRLTRSGEEMQLTQILALAQRHCLPVVATGAVRFLHEQDFEAHEARVCIHQGYVLDDVARPRNFTNRQFLQSAQQMQQLFEDLPQALVNSVELAKRCNVTLTLGRILLPEFPVPTALPVADYLAEQSRQDLVIRLELNCFNDMPENYQIRLQQELDVINKMGFAGYFLIVADFIQWAKAQSIAVGPGRGSGAGSLVAYALSITDIDPMRYDLLFERFLNPERVSMPDFDIDFCMEKRDLVIDYVANKYGRENVSQIITYGTMAAKAVLRDVGRVLAYPYGFVDKLAKLVPFEIGMTLAKALEQEEALQARYQEEEVKTLFNLAQKLEGMTRNVGKHAGGLVIAPSALTDFVPLYCEPGGGSIVTQFDKDDIETVGLVKFDFLGLRTLTIIDRAVQAINARLQQQADAVVNITKIAMDDKATFALLCACETTAVFQLESRGMKDLIKRLQPDCFDDVTALVALFRPGPLQSGMVDDFIDRKHARAQVSYIHPKLETILKSTYGVILYQEQVMQIAQVLAGYSLGEADVLRRAMGKKKPEEMAKQRSIFVEQSVARGIEEASATYIFDLMEKFAGYGFNKSHSVAYALIAYQTAWLKTHYPAEFMAAVLSSDLDNTDKIVSLIDECRCMQLSIVPPHVNHSQYAFVVDDKGCLVYGLGAIKGLGQAAIDMLVEKRQAGGVFDNLFDFCERVDLKKINRRALDALIKAGALDDLGPHRAALLASVETAYLAAEQSQKREQAGLMDLFAQTSQQADTGLFVEVVAWDEATRLAAEKESLGLYLSGHPIQCYLDELQQFISCRIADLKPTEAQSVILAGWVVNRRTMQTKRGDRMAFLTLDDGSRRIELALFPKVYSEVREQLEDDQLFIAEGEVSMDEYSGAYRVSCQRLLTLAEARANYAQGIVLQLEGVHLLEHSGQLLAELLRPFCPGALPIYLAYQGKTAHAIFKLALTWQVRADLDFEAAVLSLAGCHGVRYLYPKRS